MNPVPGKRYKHRNGNIYQVIMLTNERTERPEEYPVTVVYFNIYNGTVWSRPRSDWSRSFEPCKVQPL